MRRRALDVQLTSLGKRSPSAMFEVSTNADEPSALGNAAADAGQLVLAYEMGKAPSGTRG
jgi:hypothetical protein